MSVFQQPNRCPAGCREPERCGFLEERTDSDGNPHDRCLLGIPMHDPCAWFSSAAHMLAQANSLPLG